MMKSKFGVTEVGGRYLDQWLFGRQTLIIDSD